MNAFQRMNTALMVDEAKQIFKVSRQTFVDPDILEAERAKIFDKCWLYLGHSSELPKPGDFVTRQVGGRNILFARDAKGTLRALSNTCPHRGAQVCREKHGNAKSFQCFYHGWVFGLDGALRSQPGEASYPPDFKERSTSNMQLVPRFEGFRDFNFICFDRNAQGLDKYLGPVKEYLDVIADQAETGITILGRIALYNRTLSVFPNLVVNDIMAVTIRTYYPLAPDFMNISAWALAPKEETDWARKYRLFNFLEFLGPGGFATPDDVEALEQCQRGFRNSAEAQWNDISKGMGKENPSYDDELQMRAFWSNWNEHIFRVPA